MPSEVETERGQPGIGQPGRQAQHLFLATAVSVREHCAGPGAWRSEEVRRNSMSIVGHEVIEPHEFSRHLASPGHRANHRGLVTESSDRLLAEPCAILTEGNLATGKTAFRISDGGSTSQQSRWRIGGRSGIPFLLALWQADRQE
jgi:hypothetical protein